MDVLQVAPRYPPSVGGIQRHVRELSEHLSAEGHNVTVLTSDRPGNKPKTEKRNGVTVERVPAYSSYLVAPRVTSILRDRDPDVVHAHGYHSLTALFARLGIGSTPFVFTPHYLGRRGRYTRKALLTLYGLVGRSILQKADQVIAVSEWERERLQSRFGAAPTVIPNGTDVERFANADSWDHDEPYIFCLGRLEEYKGVQHVIRALPNLEYDLLVAGVGPYTDELIAIAADEGVADRVELLGYVNDDLIPRLYAGAAVHITLSEFECFGLTVAESLAAGTPCVVRDTTALSEWIGVEGCVGISTPRPKSVVSATERAASLTPDRDQLMTWKEMAKTIEKEYIELFHRAT